MKFKAVDFNLEATLDSGQVFGFKKNAHTYEGLIRGERFRLRQQSGFLFAESGLNGGARPLLSEYFDLHRDITPVYEILRSDSRLAPTLSVYKGMRLIRQDPWEALTCFIISSNNNVKRIQLIWQNLFEYYAGFPGAARIAATHERMLRQLGLGYRAPFLLHSAQYVSTNPQCFDVIREAPYEEARARAVCFPGIGPKVADCVLLYGFQKFEAFPVDVWILRAMRKLYFNNRKVSEDRVHDFAQKRWGAHAGYVQQYIFHGAKNGVI